MEPYTLLIRHAAAWASDRSRPLDQGLLAEALELREHNDGVVAQEWPPGSGERLMIVTRPAYGPPPRPEELRDTLDTFWSFLRATGRMTGRSASPADLRKEGRRAAPRMQAAYDDPARHSQGRVMAEFGRSIGVDLDGAADVDELNDRLRRVQDAWNALPQAERVRLMPDPSPKGLRGAAFTDEINGTRASPEQVPVSASDLARAAEDARGSEFVQACLRLVRWVGEGRAVTAAGLLRPALAREAYQYLDLWPWERTWEAIRRGRPERSGPDEPAVEALRADLALQAWRSAGDCLPLDRLWYAVDMADLVELRSTRAVPRAPLPQTDEEWVHTAVVLLIGQTMRLDETLTDCLALILETATGGASPIADLRQRWLATLPTRDSDVLADYFDEKFAETLFVFGDAGLWVVDGDRLKLTMLGLIFIGPFRDAVAGGRLRGGGDFT